MLQKGGQASDLGDLREPKPIDLNLNRRRPQDDGDDSGLILGQRS